MPDFTYHPFFKPLLFHLSPELARRAVLTAMAVQGTTAPGRALFRAFARAEPPSDAAVNAMGLTFPSPFGLGAGIDVDGSAAACMQSLGFGYLAVGPASSEAMAPSGETEPLRIEERRAIAWSDFAEAPSVEALLERLRAGPRIDVPIGVALRPGRDVGRAVLEADQHADFFILPANCDALVEARAATKRPLVLRLSPELDDRALDRAIEVALDLKLDGLVLVDAATCPLLPGGRIEGPFLFERALATVEYVARVAGDRLTIIGAGGVESPDDAVRMLDAGADLVELGAGFVYAGPGLPKRALDLSRNRTAPRPIARKGEARRREVPLGGPEADLAAASSASKPRLSQSDSEPSPAPFFSGWLLLALTGAILVASGFGALVLAATIKLLPNDVRFLGVTVPELCAQNACRIVHFMAHDRVSFGGSLIAIGVVHVWLAAVPIRRGAAWAYWTFALSGVLGFLSFLTYLGFGYLDKWHAAATLLLLPVFGLGLVGAFPHLRGSRSPASLLKVGARAWLWSPAGMGRACISFSAIGMILGGITIMIVGMTRVFVPTDLEYIGVTVEELRALNPHLIPLIAHDRAGFGGGLCSGGVTILLTLWCGARPGERGLWLALCLSGIAGFSTAIGIHPIVGYMSFMHLLPAYLGALAFVVGIVLLRKPMLEPDRGIAPRRGDRAREHGHVANARFPDL